MTTEIPKLHRVAAGDYESDDGVFNLVKLIDVNPPAWNVRYGNDFACDHPELTDLIVDGAASKRDALAIFAEWWQENGHPDPTWTRT